MGDGPMTRSSTRVEVAGLVAGGNVGANATEASSTLLGGWMATIVATRPIRSASRGASHTDVACSGDLAKNKMVKSSTWARGKGSPAEELQFQFATKTKSGTLKLAERPVLPRHTIERRTL